MACLACNIVAGDWNFTFTVRAHLRKETVRRINRHRRPQRRVPFICKYRLARQTLEDCRRLTPKDVTTYVLFDAWYPSARLLKYTRRQGWHAICGVRSKRQLSGQRLGQRFKTQRHQGHVYVEIHAADGSSHHFLMRHMTGRLNQARFDDRGSATKRHYRDQRPAYFISTDLPLAPHTALHWCAERWNCEVDNLYLEGRFGLGDFRLEPYAAIDKFCTVDHLAHAYTPWRLAHTTDRHVK